MTRSANPTAGSALAGVCSAEGAGENALYTVSARLILAEILVEIHAQWLARIPAHARATDE